MDICDGISDAVEEFSHHPGINQTRQATEKRNVSTEMGADSAGGNSGASTGQNGWMETLLCRDSTVGRGCNARAKKRALAYQGHVIKYDENL